MCGRITLTVAEIYRLMEELPFECVSRLKEFRPSYNIPPSTEHPVILSEKEEYALIGATWGLIPRWAKDESKAFINCRSETAAEKPAFRDALLKRRCLVPADGFYEWKSEDKIKQPYWFHLPERKIFYFAGVYEEPPPQLKDVTHQTFSILTTAAENWMKPYHERMPVVLPRPFLADWVTTKELSRKEGEDLLHSILRSPPQMEMHAVSRRVNSPRNNDAALLQQESLSR